MFHSWLGKHGARLHFFFFLPSGAGIPIERREFDQGFRYGVPLGSRQLARLHFLAPGADCWTLRGLVRFGLGA